MTPEEQRTAIGQTLGWAYRKTVNDIPYGRAPEWQHPKQFGNEVPWDIPFPDYLNNLNAMHEAEKVLIALGGLPTYEHFLRLNEVSDNNQPWYGSIHATAAQRAEAFLRTHNLWKE